MTREPAGAESHVEEERILHSHAGRYYLVWILLCVLTVATFLLARAPLGVLHVPVALLIATAKGTLVALFFMHLWEHRGANRLVILTSLVFVVLLIVLTVADNLTRFPLANPPREGAWAVDPQLAHPPPPELPPGSRGSG